MDIFKPALRFVWKIVELADNKRLSRQEKQDGVVEICDIPYIDDGEKGHLLDVYYPEEHEGKLPLIIDVHGGGWLYGYKEINKHYCFSLAKRGFCVVSINYRLADKVRFIEQLRDVFFAFRWIDGNMNAYPADMQNVFLTGDSAGGHLVCLASAINISESLMKKFDLQNNNLNFKCIGATSPIIDLIDRNPILNINLNVLLDRPYKKADCYELMRFENIVSADLPPFYIVTSEGDFVQKQGIRLHEILNTLGVENTLHNWTKSECGKRLPHVFSIAQPLSPEGSQTIDEMTDFFKRHM